MASSQPEEIMIKIDTAIDNAATAKTIKELKKSIQELKGIAATIGPEAGEAFETATAAAAEFQDRIDDVNDALKNAKGEGIEGLKSGFGDLTTALGNLDFDKAGQAIDSMNNNFNKIDFNNISQNFDNFKLKVNDFASTIKAKIGEQSSTTMKGFGNVVGGVSKSLTSALGGDLTGVISGVGTSFKGLGQIILANPLFALATVIVGLIANFEKFKEVGGALGKVFTGVSFVIENVTQAFKDLTDAIGLTDFAGQKLAKQQKELSDRRIEYANKANQKAAEEMVNLRLLYDAATNANIPLKDRIELSEELQDLYPEIFANYTAEQIALGKSTAAFEKLNAQILKTAQLEAYKAELVDITRELIKNQNAVDIARDTYSSIRNFTPGVIPSVFAKQNSDAVSVINANNENLKRQGELLKEIGKIVGETTIINSKSSKENTKNIKNTTEELKLGFDLYEKFINTRISFKPFSDKESDSFISTIKIVQDSINSFVKNINSTEFIASLLGEDGDSLLTNLEKSTERISRNIQTSVIVTGQEIDKSKQNIKSLVSQLDALKNKNGVIKGPEKIKSAKELQEKIKEQEDYNNKLLELDKKLKSDSISIETGYIKQVIEKQEFRLSNELFNSDKSLEIRKNLLKEQKKIDDLEANNDTEKLKNNLRRYNESLNNLLKSYKDYANKREQSELESRRTTADLTNDPKTIMEANKLEYDIKLQDLNTWYQTESELAREHQEELFDIQNEYSEKTRNLKEYYRQADISAQLQANQKNIAVFVAYGDAVNQLTGAIFDYKLNRMEKGTEQEKKVAKQQFNLNKGLQLGIATTTGVMSVMAAYENGMKNPVPMLGPATATVYAVQAGIVSAANIAKIAATKFDPGGSSSGSSGSVASIGNLGGSVTDIGSKSSSISAPELFDIGNTSYNNDRSTLRVAVVESDIRNMTQKVNVLESASYFNGP